MVTDKGYLSGYTNGAPRRPIVEAIAILIGIVSTLVAFAFAAINWGVDSRDLGPRGQI